MTNNELKTAIISVAAFVALILLWMYVIQMPSLPKKSGVMNYLFSFAYSSLMFAGGAFCYFVISHLISAPINRHNQQIWYTIIFWLTIIGLFWGGMPALLWLLPNVISPSQIVLFALLYWVVASAIAGFSIFQAYSWIEKLFA